MIGDGEALFRALCANPTDDLPRLVYADWLQENGQVERADFIRLQCEAWHLCPAYPTINEARTAASRLLKKYGDEWYAELPDIPGVEWSDLFVRGFVHAAWVEATRDVRAQLEAVFAAAPVQHLAVVDFGLAGLKLLFESEFADRLTTLVRHGKGAGFNAGVGKLVAEARERFPNLDIDGKRT